MESSILEQRAVRVRGIRKALRLTRKAMRERYNIPQASLQNWEDGRNGGLTERGVKRIVDAFCEEGVPCTEEWLLHGEGEDPLLSLTNPVVQSVTEDAIAQELALFHQLNPNAIDTVVKDDSLRPTFRKGDLVAGQRMFGTEMKAAVGLHCIAQTKKGDVFVSMLTENIAQDLRSVAPIIWVRRELPSVENN